MADPSACTMAYGAASPPGHGSSLQLLRRPNGHTRCRFKPPALCHADVKRWPSRRRERIAGNAHQRACMHGCFEESPTVMYLLEIGPMGSLRAKAEPKGGKLAMQSARWASASPCQNVHAAHSVQSTALSRGAGRPAVSYREKSQIVRNRQCVDGRLSLSFNVNGLMRCRKVAFDVHRSGTLAGLCFQGKERCRAPDLSRRFSLARRCGARGGQRARDRRREQGGCRSRRRCALGRTRVDAPAAWVRYLRPGWTTCLSVPGPHARGAEPTTRGSVGAHRATGRLRFLPRSCS